MVGPRNGGRIAAGGLLLAAAGVLLWRLASSPLEPVVWSPPAPPPLTGPLAPDDRLTALERWPLDQGRGPEDVAVGPEGGVYAGVEDGRVVRWGSGAASAERFASTGGRPLGLAFAPGGDLVVADARRGLLRVGPSGAVSRLVGAPELPLSYANGVDVGPDGTIYFTNPSARFPARDRRLSLLSGRREGRVLAYDPRTGGVSTVMDSLHHPNGVAVHPSGRFLVVAETGRYRVWRRWLSGPRAGRAEVLLSNLPGFPDGLSFGRGRALWVALAALRSPVVDALAGRPGLRNLLVSATALWRPSPEGYGLVVRAGPGGRIRGSLHAPAGEFAWISSAVPHGDHLYLGSIRETSVGRVPLAAARAAAGAEGSRLDRSGRFR